MTGESSQIGFEMTVDEVMRRWPATIRVFLDFRMNCVGCPIAGFHTVEDACREHGAVPGDFLSALRAYAATQLNAQPGGPSAMPKRRCGSRTMMRCRPLSTRPCCSHALNTRLTVWSVVPVISATSWRLIGKSISIPAFNLAARLLQKPQQCMRDAPLHFLGRHLDDAGMRFLKPLPDRLQRVRGKRGVLRHKPRPCGGRPGQRHAVDGCDRGRRVVLEADRLRDAENFACRHIAHDDLLAVGRGFFGPDMAVQQKEKRVGLLALLENV